MPDCLVSSSTRFATTSGIVPGFSAAVSSSLRSWRTVSSSSCFSFLSSAFVLSMTVVEPLTAASALSAPVRWATCSGVTSVAADQSARLALVDTGQTRPVTVARNASASFWAGLALAFFPGFRELADLPSLADSGGLAVAAAATAPADRQATRTPMCRIEAGMSRPYNKSGGRSLLSAVWPCGRTKRVVTERPRMNPVRKWLSVAGMTALLIGGVACKQGEGGRCEQQSDCADGLHCDDAKPLDATAGVCRATPSGGTAGAGGTVGTGGAGGEAGEGGASGGGGRGARAGGAGGASGTGGGSGGAGGGSGTGGGAAGTTGSGGGGAGGGAGAGG